MTATPERAAATGDLFAAIAAVVDARRHYRRFRHRRPVRWLPAALAARLYLALVRRSDR